MNKIKACIFDLDGTIVDSMFLFGINIVNTLQSYGVTPPEDIVRIVTPIGYNNCIDYCIDQFKLKTTHEEMLGKMDAFALPYYRDTILAKEYTKDFFEKLKSQNIKICLLTASPRRFFEPCLERVGLL
ncbi:MAG: HAD family phosphatase, partial [Clostridia bacterium]|nr:HAD family phosphatase [Clostridia bacterium]